MKKFSFLLILLAFSLTACSDNFNEIPTNQEYSKVEKISSPTSAYSAEIQEIKKINDTVFYVRATTTMSTRLIKSAWFEWTMKPQVPLYNSNSCCGNLYFTYIKKRDTNNKYYIRYNVNNGEVLSQWIPFETAIIWKISDNNLNHIMKACEKSTINIEGL